MRLVAFSEQAGASQVGLIRQSLLVNLCAVFERILFDKDRRTIPGDGGGVLEAAAGSHRPRARDRLAGLLGVLWVRGNTADRHLGVAELIEYLSRDVTLYPGNLIATGAMAMAEYAPQVIVQIGNQVGIEIAQIGALRNHIEG